jgi:hypothetical protein
MILSNALMDYTYYVLRQINLLLGNSDFYEDHHHEVGATTGLAIPVGEGRHVHFVSGTTTFNDGHVHQFIFVTQIENPIEE